MLEPARDKLFVGITAAVVLAAAGIGLYLSGSPVEQRLLRLDEQRARDLSTLANHVDNYRYSNAEVPETPSELITALRLTDLPTDPATGASYDYEKLGADTYRLCASFDRPSPDDLGYESFWRHDSGRECFTMEAPQGRPAVVRPAPPSR